MSIQLAHTIQPDIIPMIETKLTISERKSWEKSARCCLNTSANDHNQRHYKNKHNPKPSEIKCDIISLIHQHRADI